MIVVDMQNDFVAEGAKLQSAQAHAMVPKLAATLRFCREKGIRVVYTAHVHRRDGCDMGLYDDLYSVVADRSVLVMDRRGPRSTKTWRRRRASTSSKNTAIARSSRPTLI
jgi:ureidoacrylate peracid hydrolase